MILSKDKIVVKVNPRFVENFNSLVDSYGDAIKKSLLIKFNLTDNGLTEVQFVKCKTDWDRGKKDYNICLLQYNVEDGYFYYAPQASVGHIPLIDAVAFTEEVIRRFGQSNNMKLSVKLGRVLLNKFFQNVKCSTIDTSLPIENVFSTMINYAGRKSGVSITSLLLHKDHMSDKSVNMTVTGDQFHQFGKIFCTILTSITEAFNTVMSGIELPVSDGFFDTSVIIHKNSNEFFRSKAYEDIKWFNENSYLSLISYASINLIFNPIARNSFEAFINRRGNGCATGKYGKAFASALKVYQTVDMLTDYETTLYEVAPVLGVTVNNQLMISKFRTPSGSASKFILNLGDLMNFFTNYNKVYSAPKSDDLQKALDKAEKEILSNNDQENFKDYSVYQLNDKLLRQMIQLFS